MTNSRWRGKHFAQQLLLSDRQPVCRYLRNELKSVHQNLHTHLNACTHRDIQSSPSLQDPSLPFDNIL